MQRSGRSGGFEPQTWIPSVYNWYCLATKMHGGGCRGVGRMQ